MRTIFNWLTSIDVHTPSKKLRHIAWAISRTVVKSDLAVSDIRPEMIATLLWVFEVFSKCSQVEFIPIYVHVIEDNRTNKQNNSTTKTKRKITGYILK